MGVVYAIASAKGGVGKTTTSINVGAGLAANRGSVLVIEVDLAMANILDFLALDFDPDHDPSLHTVLEDKADPASAIYRVNEGLDVMPSGPDLEGFAASKPQRLGSVVEALREQYDFILLDTGAGLSYETLLPLGLANAVVLVSTPRLAAVRDTKKTKDLTKRIGGEVAGIVFTKSGTGSAPPPDRIAKFLEVEAIGHVPDDPAVPGAQDRGIPVIAHDIASPAARAYLDIAEKLARKASNYRSAPMTGGSDDVEMAQYFS